MKIFFDGRWKHKDGIGKFSNILREYIPMKIVQIPCRPLSFLDPIFLNLYLILFVPKGGALFTPGFNVPLFPSKKFIFVIHDLNHIDRRENSSLHKTFYYNFLIKRSLKAAKIVFTGSEFSKERIADWAGINGDKIKCLGYGVSNGYTPDATPFLPGYKYFLCVSNRKKHKNEANLIRAFLLSNLDPGIKLAFTGEMDTFLKNLIEGLGAFDRIIFFGQVDESKMPSIYVGAIALLFPSYYEGFGLPVIEAMACGTPVLTSNASALREVANESAVLVDPEDINSISLGISALFHNIELRRSLSVSGLARVKRYGWDKVIASINFEFSRVGIND